MVKDRKRGRAGAPKGRRGGARGPRPDPGLKAKGFAVAHPKLGPRLRLIREGAGVSQAELARQLGTNQGNLSRIERGQEMTLTIFLQICRLLGADATQLIR